MAEETKQPRVINKSGSLQMADKEVARRNENGNAEQGQFRDNRSRSRRRDIAIDGAPKEFEELTISIDRVARVVKGGRRFRFKALVAIGNKKDKIGIGIAKGADVTAAVTKATARAKKNMIKIHLNKTTLCHEVETKVTGARVLMKPAAPGTGIIAGGVVRSIIGLTGIKDLISKSLGSTNKVNISYAVIEGLKSQVPRKEWLNVEKASKTKKEEK
jgi:small subunit ribosomal protein S5